MNEYTGLSLITGPEVEPVTLSEAKAHLRVDGNDDDAIIAANIASARAHIENHTGAAIITQTWEVAFGRFGRELRLPRPPLIAVSAITYIDTAGDEQTLAATEYRTTGAAQEGLIVPVPGHAWPATYDVPDAVTVTYTAGHGPAGANVPMPLRQAVLLLAGHWYENREAVSIGQPVTDLPHGVAALIAPYRVRH